MSELSTKIDDFFHISERGSDIRTEIRGGIITFLAMLYILAVNPSILSSTTGIDFQDLVGATALAACTVGTLVIVGFMMIRTVKDINWMNPISLATAFTTIFMMGLTGSITDGIALGSMVYLWGMVLTGKKSEIPTVMSVVGVVFLAYFVLTYTVIPNI